MFKKGLQGLIDGSIDLDTNTLKAVLIDTGAYTVNLSTHDNLDDVAGGSRIATSSALGGITVTDGVFDANDVTFTAVTGASVEAIIIYKDTGTESTSRLIAYIVGGRR
jgi:hypothetical protein